MAIHSAKSKSIIRKAITTLTPFKLNKSLTGQTDASLYNGYGQLSRDLQDTFEQDRKNIDYVVLSYNTPIAWHTPKGWTIPAAKYSATTTNHQHQIRIYAN